MRRVLEANMRKVLFITLALLLTFGIGASWIQFAPDPSFLTLGRVGFYGGSGLVKGDADLTFVSDTLKATTANVTTLNAPTGRAGTYIVATSDAMVTEKAQADYTLPGTEAGDTAMLQAVNAVAGGGVIQILGKTVNISSFVTDNCTLRGSGNSNIWNAWADNVTYALGTTFRVSGGISVKKGGRFQDALVVTPASFNGTAVAVGGDGQRIRYVTDILSNIVAYCPTQTGTGISIIADGTTNDAMITLSSFGPFYTHGFKHGVTMLSAGSTNGAYITGVSFQSISTAWCTYSVNMSATGTVTEVSGNTINDLQMESIDPSGSTSGLTMGGGGLVSANAFSHVMNWSPDRFSDKALRISANVTNNTLYGFWGGSVVDGGLGNLVYDVVSNVPTFSVQSPSYFFVAGKLGVGDGSPSIIVLAKALSICYEDANTLAIKDAEGSAYKDLRASNILLGTDLYAMDSNAIHANAANGKYTTFTAFVTDNVSREVARMQGAADPYFSLGGSQQFKVGYSGNITITGLPTSDPHVLGQLWVDAASGNATKISGG